MHGALPRHSVGRGSRPAVRSLRVTMNALFLYPSRSSAAGCSSTLSQWRRAGSSASQLTRGLSLLIKEPHQRLSIWSDDQLETNVALGIEKFKDRVLLFRLSQEDSTRDCSLPLPMKRFIDRGEDWSFEAISHIVEGEAPVMPAFFVHTQQLHLLVLLVTVKCQAQPARWFPQRSFDTTIDQSAAFGSFVVEEQHACNITWVGMLFVAHDGARELCAIGQAEADCPIWLADVDALNIQYVQIGMFVSLHRRASQHDCKRCDNDGGSKIQLASLQPVNLEPNFLVVLDHPRSSRPYSSDCPMRHVHWQMRDSSSAPQEPFARVTHRIQRFHRAPEC